MIDDKDLQITTFSTSAGVGLNSGTVIVVHIPTGYSVREEWVERNHESLARVKDRALLKLRELMEEAEMTTKEQ